VPEITRRLSVSLFHFFQKGFLSTRPLAPFLGISLVAVNSDPEARLQWYVDMLKKTIDDISSNLGYLRI
jgi:hypothetical protein